MRSLVTLSIALSLSACAKKESGSAGSGSAATPPPSEPAPPAPKPVPPPQPSAADDESEIAQLVVHDVGSKALGSQTIEASCVAVSVVPVDKWRVATARLKDCGDKTARSIVWLYKRSDNGKWSEDYVGQPPKCWKGVPPDIAEAVAKLTKIPTC